MAVIPSLRMEAMSWPCELITASTPAEASQATPARSCRRPLTRSMWTATSLPASWIRRTSGVSDNPLPRRMKRTGARLDKAASTEVPAVMAAQHGSAAIRAMKARGSGGA